MKKITTIAALLTALGGSAAMAQGLPPGSAAWQSGWPNFIETQREQAMSPGEAGTTRSATRVMGARRNESIPVAGNTQDTHRGS